jgi:hypothetical protein
MLQFLFLPRQNTEFDLLFTEGPDKLQVIICFFFQRKWQSVWLTCCTRKGLARLCLFSAFVKVCRNFERIENVQVYCKSHKTSCDELRQDVSICGAVFTEVLSGMLQQGWTERLEQQTRESPLRIRAHSQIYLPKSYSCAHREKRD